MTTRIVRLREWAFPPPPVRREVLHARPDVDDGRPPVLFVPGFGHGAWAFADHWLEHTAARGFPAYAMSLRGHGTSGTAPKTGRSRRCGRTSRPPATHSVTALTTPAATPSTPHPLPRTRALLPTPDP